MKTLWLIVFLLHFNLLFAYQPDSTALYPLSKWERAKLRIDKATSSRAYQMTYIGVPLIAAGLVLQKENKNFRGLRNRYVPRFEHHYDDYLQYLPLAATFGMKLAGVENRNSWGRMVVSDAFSAILMASAVNIIKNTAEVMRPDGSSRNSFPSGHSATAFMSATIFHKEYGTTRSPWYSIGGYSVATATAIGRQLNNRHWLSDVMVGAGIGILSTELGYFFADLIFKDKGILREQLKFGEVSKDTPPSFLGYYLGLAMISGKHACINGVNFYTATGASAGFEGAWFANPYIGVGGRLRISNVPTSITGDYAHAAEEISPGSTDVLSLDAGAYFSYPFSNRWRVGSKLLLGTQYSRGSKITAIYKNEEGINEERNIMEFGEFHSISVGTGISTTYILKRNFSVRFFFDYDFIPTHLAFDLYTSGMKEKHKISKPTHLLVLGSSVNINF